MRVQGLSSKRYRYSLLTLLILTTGLFLIGLSMPIMTVSKFIFLDNTFSISSGIYDLFAEGRYFLFVVILGLSVLLPVLKLGVLFYLLLSFEKLEYLNKTKRLLNLMHDYGRWAMLDVMVVALLIVTVKLGAFVNIQTHNGLYVFGISVLLTMAVTHLVVRAANKKGDSKESPFI